MKLTTFGSAFLSSALILGLPSTRAAEVDQRVVDEAAVQRIYASHRTGSISPKALSSEESSARASRRVDEIGRKIAALRELWNVEVSDRELEVELRRMVRASKSPEVLREIFEVLGNDSSRVADAIARPVLADRKLRQLFDGDPRFAKQSFDAWWAAAREATAPRRPAPPRIGRIVAPTATTTTCDPDTWTRMDSEFPESRWLHSAAWTGSEMLIWGGFEGVALAHGWRYDPATDTWSRMSRAGEPTGRGAHVAVWTGTDLIVWGGGSLGSPPATSGGRYNAATDTWSPISTTNQPAPRDDAVAVWTGTLMIVWGGTDSSGAYLRDGGRYDPTSNTWTAIEQFGAPSGRIGETAVWSGNQMIVWGGVNTTGVLGFGARYNPSSNQWTSVSNTLAPSAREGHKAVWTGSRMVVWGGRDNAGTDQNTGGMYNPSANTWQATSTIGAPSGRDSHSLVWTGSRAVVWGGYDSGGIASGGGSFDPVTNTWSALATSGAPALSAGHSAVWTGTKMIVWGGNGDAGQMHSGGRYDPATNSWALVSSSYRPAARSLHAQEWTGAELLVWGGQPYVYSASLDAARYDPATDTWAPISLVGSPPSRWAPASAWTGNEMIVWGGAILGTTGSDQEVGGGGRYDPSLDAWLPMTTAQEPVPSIRPRWVFTGNQLVVWGGAQQSGAYLDTGGRYQVSSDSWSPIRTDGAPSPRDGHSIVWTGREMIVYGGNNTNGLTHDAARYDPEGDVWTSISTDGATPRHQHVAAWTGHNMVTWTGLENPPNIGEYYDLREDSWTPVAADPTASIEGWSAATVACSRMIVHGEEASDGNSRTVLLDPSTDTWFHASRVDQPFGASFGRVSTDGRRIFVFGGSGTESSYPTDSGGVYCACAELAPLTTRPTLYIDRIAGTNRLRWTTIPEATAYDVVVGSLAVLRSSGGNFTIATTGCLVSGADASGAVDPSSATTDGAWYLLRTAQGATKGSYDTGSPRQVGLRDAEIAASPSACP